MIVLDNDLAVDSYCWSCNTLL